MSVKLSELLEAAEFHLSRAAKRFESESWDDPAADELSDKAFAFRAIAPAMVEFVALTMAAAKYREDIALTTVRKVELSKKYDLANDARDRLFEAMKEAGVTCE